jgi:hypothetical protein
MNMSFTFGVKMGFHAEGIGPTRGLANLHGIADAP